MPTTSPRRVAQQRVAPGDRAALAGAGDDVALVVGERLLLAAQHAREVVAPRGAVLLGDDGVVPVAADQLAVLVAEQLAAVAVEQLDGLVGAQDEQDRARDVEVVLGARLGELALGDVDHHALAAARAGRRRRARSCRAPTPRRREPSAAIRRYSRSNRSARPRSCAAPPPAPARGRRGAGARSTARARRRSARRGSRAGPRSAGETNSNGKPWLPPRDVGHRRDLFEQARGSGDLRVRAPPAYAPRRKTNRWIGALALGREIHDDLAHAVRRRRSLLQHGREVAISRRTATLSPSIVAAKRRMPAARAAVASSRASSVPRPRPWNGSPTTIANSAVSGCVWRGATQRATPTIVSGSSASTAASARWLWPSTSVR